MDQQSPSVLSSVHTIPVNSSITDGKHQQAVRQELLSQECFHLFVQLWPSTLLVCLVCWISVSVLPDSQFLSAVNAQPVHACLPVQLSV